VIRGTGSGYLPLETVRCLDPQGPMCGRAISRTRKSPRNFPPPDEGRRFFCAPGASPKHQPEERKPEVKTLIAIALFAASIIEALAQTHVRGYYRKDGSYVEPHWRSNPNSTTYDNWSTRGNANPYTGEVGRPTMTAFATTATATETDSTRILAGNVSGPVREPGVLSEGLRFAPSTS
jgi:hypothetical protein